MSIEFLNGIYGKSRVRLIKKITPKEQLQLEKELQTRYENIGLGTFEILKLKYQK